jgi:hypothetical protein
MPPKTVKGLRLTAPGAPLEPHTIHTDSGASQLPGMYSPHIPAPVGGPGELTVKQAEKYAADESIPLELVDIDDEATARAYWADVKDALDHGEARWERVKALGGATTSKEND